MASSGVDTGVSVGVLDAPQWDVMPDLKDAKTERLRASIVSDMQLAYADYLQSRGSLLSAPPAPHEVLRHYLEKVAPRRAQIERVLRHRAEQRALSNMMFDWDRVVDVTFDAESIRQGNELYSLPVVALAPLEELNLSAVHSAVLNEAKGLSGRTVVSLDDLARALKEQQDSLEGQRNIAQARTTNILAGLRTLFGLLGVQVPPVLADLSSVRASDRATASADQSTERQVLNELNAAVDAVRAENRQTKEGLDRVAALAAMVGETCSDIPLVSRQGTLGRPFPASNITSAAPLLVSYVTEWNADRKQDEKLGIEFTNALMDSMQILAAALGISFVQPSGALVDPRPSALQASAGRPTTSALSATSSSSSSSSGGASAERSLQWTKNDLADLAGQRADYLSKAEAYRRSNENWRDTMTATVDVLNQTLALLGPGKRKFTRDTLPSAVDYLNTELTQETAQLREEFSATADGLRSIRYVADALSIGQVSGPNGAIAKMQRILADTLKATTSVGLASGIIAPESVKVSMRFIKQLTSFAQSNENELGKVTGELAAAQAALAEKEQQRRRGMERLRDLQRVIGQVLTDAFRVLGPTTAPYRTDSPATAEAQFREQETTPDQEFAQLLKNLSGLYGGIKAAGSYISNSDLSKSISLLVTDEKWATSITRKEATNLLITQAPSHVETELTALASIQAKLLSTVEQRRRGSERVLQLQREAQSVLASYVSGLGGSLSGATSADNLSSMVEQTQTLWDRAQAERAATLKKTLDAEQEAIAWLQPPNDRFPPPATITLQETQIPSSSSSSSSPQGEEELSSSLRSGSFPSVPSTTSPLASSPAASAPAPPAERWLVITRLDTTDLSPTPLFIQRDANAPLLSDGATVQEYYLLAKKAVDLASKGALTPEQVAMVVNAYTSVVSRIVSDRLAVLSKEKQGLANTAKSIDALQDEMLKAARVAFPGANVLPSAGTPKEQLVRIIEQTALAEYKRTAKEVDKDIDELKEVESLLGLKPENTNRFPLSDQAELLTVDDLLSQIRGVSLESGSGSAQPVIKLEAVLEEARERANAVSARLVILHDATERLKLERRELQQQIKTLRLDALNEESRKRQLEISAAYRPAAETILTGAIFYANGGTQPLYNALDLALNPFINRAWGLTYGGPLENQPGVLYFPANTLQFSAPGPLGGIVESVLGIIAQPQPTTMATLFQPYTALLQSMQADPLVRLRTLQAALLSTQTFLITVGGAWATSYPSVRTDAVNILRYLLTGKTISSMTSGMSVDAFVDQDFIARNHPYNILDKVPGVADGIAFAPTTERQLWREFPLPLGTSSYLTWLAFAFRLATLATIYTPAVVTNSRLSDYEYDAGSETVLTTLIARQLNQLLLTQETRFTGEAIASSTDAALRQVKQAFPGANLDAPLSDTLVDAANQDALAQRINPAFRPAAGIDVTRPVQLAPQLSRMPIANPPPLIAGNTPVPSVYSALASTAQSESSSFALATPVFTDNGDSSMISADLSVFPSIPQAAWGFGSY